MWWQIRNVKDIEDPAMNVQGELYEIRAGEKDFEGHDKKIMSEVSGVHK